MGKHFDVKGAGKMQLELADDEDDFARAKTLPKVEAEVDEDAPTQQIIIMRGFVPVPKKLRRARDIKEACDHILKYRIRVDIKAVLKLETLRHKAFLLGTVRRLTSSPEEQAFYLGISTTALANWNKEIDLLPHTEAGLNHSYYNF